eukprot:2645103-Amphidinium_carterae.1
MKIALCFGVFPLLLACVVVVVAGERCVVLSFSKAIEVTSLEHITRAGAWKLHDALDRNHAASNSCFYPCGQ